MMQINIHDLQVNPVFDTLLHSLHPQEQEALKESMLAEGWRESDPAKVWGDTIIDGHNRYRVASELGITNIPVSPLFFESDTEARVWILRNQIARRNTPEQLRSLYVGQLVELLKGDAAISKTVQEIASKEGRSERQVWRDVKTTEAFNNADPETRQDFIDGEVSVKELIEAVRPILSPPPPQHLTKEELAEQSRKAFPQAAKIVAKRVVTGIQNLRSLASDVEIVFKNQGLDLALFAPEIAAFASKLQGEEIEADRLTRIKYQDEQFIVSEPEIVETESTESI